MIPLIMENDLEVIHKAIESLALENPAELRAAIIKNTLELEEFYVSEAVLPELNSKVSVESDPFHLIFNKQGELNM